MDSDRMVSHKPTELTPAVLAQVVSMLTGMDPEDIDNVVVLVEHNGRTSALSLMPAPVLGMYLVDVITNLGMGMAQDAAVDSVEIPDDLSGLSG